MKKYIVCELYYFEDTANRKRFYFENKATCERARFMAYKCYDMYRLSKKGFVVPVGQVKKILVKEEDLSKITVYKDENISKIFKKEVVEHNSTNVVIR